MKNSVARKDGQFVTPDGGYGWIIMIAAGISNLVVFPAIQQFGLLFRDKFKQIGMSSSETTTIANINLAMNYGAGLLNGPVFRMFTYRQVALAGALITFVALFSTAHAHNFLSYLLTYSIIYGVGVGILASANALALNTYWKKRRRIATGFSWTITGFGPIMTPYVVTGLSPIYGESGTIFVLSGFALHAIACALLLHPVEWHSKPDDDKESSKIQDDINNLEGIKNGNMTSEILDDDPANTGYEFIDPGVPMMITAQDGYFSISQSRAPSRGESKKSSMLNLCEIRSRKSSVNCDTNKPRERTILHTLIPETDAENHPDLNGGLKVVFPLKTTLETDTEEYSNEQNDVLQQASDKLAQYASENRDDIEATHKLLQSKENGKVIETDTSSDVPVKLTLTKKIVMFFDLDLLKDFSFLNILIGMTLANFSDFNFSVLTPFVLLDFGMTRPEVALYMSLVAGVDIVSRFSFSLIAGKIGWDNTSFYLFGMMITALGRVVLAHFQDSYIVLCTAVLIGFGKGLRTVFMALVIPSYVPLDKLPGASGLQLVASAILFFALGPFVGWIKDNTSSSVTLHCLNIFTWLTAISWTMEKYIKKMKQNPEPIN